MKHHYDCIVVGLGAMGSATCYHLAKRGAKVLGIERFDIPHGNGSSTGFSRMIRLCYGEHAGYVPLLKSAFSLWRDLEAASGQKLMHVTGGIYMGAPGDAMITGAIRAAEKFALPYQQLDREALSKRYPEFQVPDNFTGMWEPNAGLILPELAIATHALLALQLGAELHGQEKVTSWSKDGLGVRVETERGDYNADRIIFCGGAWTDKLVRDLDIPLRVTRQVLGWVWPKEPKRFALGHLPVWQICRSDGSAHYGFPMMEDSPGFKIAHHTRMTTTDPDAVQRSIQPGDEETFRGVLRDEIPAANGPLLSLRTCLYVNSPDLHFIVDQHPRHDRVLLACGFSGHGFKFAPVIGQALCDLAIDGRTDHQIGFLGLSRFGPSQ
jgi:sarcosine oxidase